MADHPDDLHELLDSMLFKLHPILSGFSFFFLFVMNSVWIVSGALDDFQKFDLNPSLSRFINQYLLEVFFFFLGLVFCRFIDVFCFVFL